jgi:Fe/S biogenesis protein NfuA
MLTFTEAARARVRSFLADFGDDGALRISLEAGASPLAPQFELELIEPGDHEGDDVVLNSGDFPVYVEAASAERLEGAVVDFSGGAFEVALSAEAPLLGGELAERVARVIEERVNPGIAAHGGRIALMGVHDQVAWVRMSGGCQGCGLAAVTLRQGVERMLREAVPEIVGVRDVTDHAGGRNPFYRKS